MGITSTALLTEEQFADLPQEENRHNELVPGEIVALGYASYLHERVKSNIIKIFTRYRASDRHLQLREGQYVEEPSFLPGFRVGVTQFFDGI